MREPERLIGPHGGYRTLKTFHLAQLVYDSTVIFCRRYIERGSRTHDQMVQAARSGVQNIAEGSQASGTSKKTEIKLTHVARSSLEELRLDYEDFLRQRRLPQLGTNDPILKRFKVRRCSTLADVRAWIADEKKLCTSLSSSMLAANGVLSLLNILCYLLDRQVGSQGRDFEREGGFSERLYRVRSAARKGRRSD